MTKITGYQLVDIKTKTVLKTYEPTKFHIATRRADKLDLKYGAIRYSVRPLFEEVK